MGFYEVLNITVEIFLSALFFVQIKMIVLHFYGLSWVIQPVI